MKRFLEYLEEQRRLMLDADKPHVSYRFSWQDIDLTDGRQVIRLARRGFIDANAQVPKDGLGRPLRVDPQPTFGSLGGQVILPSDSEVRSGDVVTLALVDPKGHIDLSDSYAKAGLLGFYRDRQFVDGFAFQLSFEQLVTFMIRAKLRKLNPKMLVPMQNTRSPMYEDMTITVSPPPDPNEYDREAVVKAVKNPKSHFNSNKERVAKYASQIVQSKGELGRTIMIKRANPEIKECQYDNYYTDQNWYVAVQPRTGFVYDIQKIHPKKLVQIYGLGKTFIPPYAVSKWQLDIPAEAMLRSCEESIRGEIV